MSENTADTTVAQTMADNITALSIIKDD